ncbi:MAG: protein-L-isoaspartate O-methyltransferase family protein [Acidimicrobiales bacterium]
MSSDTALRAMLARLRRVGITEPTIEALARVRREEFVPRFWSGGAAHTAGSALDLLYDPDQAVAITKSGTSTATAPRVVAGQADILAIEPGMSILEVGTGPGYFAAVLAELVGPSGRVVTVEIDPAVASDAASRLERYETVEVQIADGHIGCAGSFDRVVASVGCNDVARSWLDSLRPGGFALAPVRHGSVHPMMRVDPEGDGTVVMRTGYVAIQGAQASRPLWPFMPATVPPTASRRVQVRVARVGDLGFWIAVEDPRASALNGISDGTSMAELLAARGVVCWGGPSGPALAEELLAHVDRWLAAGAPEVEAYHHRFVTQPGDARWALRRVDHVQLVDL